MTSGRLELVISAALAGLTVVIAVASLAGTDGDPWVQLVLLALAPVIFVAPHLFLDLLRDGGSERVLERATSPLVGACFALSFFALAIVVGAGVAGWIGGVVGGIVGFVLALQGMSARRRIRSAIGLDERKQTQDGNQLAMLALTGLGLVAMTALLAGFGYLLFGRIGAIVMGIFQGILLLSMLVAGVVGAQRRGETAVDSGPPRSSS